jgi:hypothetical protein
MKKLYFIASIALFLSIMLQNAYSQPNFAIVSQDGQTKIATTLVDAIDQASDGDFIYLPPGNFGEDEIEISKELHLIGVGHYPQATVATGETILNGNLRFMTGADGSSVQGVRVNGSIICGTDETNCNVSDLVIKRCFARRIYLSYGWDKETTGSNFLITENVIAFAFYGGYGANTVFSKNILIQGTLQERPLTYLKNAIVENNVLLSIDNVMGNLVTGTTFRNNVIPVGNLQVINKYGDNIYLNNLHTVEGGLATYGVVQSEGNVVIPRENMFVNQEGGSFSL